jgi:hypothetical protein
MRKNSWLVLLTVTVLLAGCGRTRSSPEKVVMKFWDAYLQGDPTTAKELMTAEAPARFSTEGVEWSTPARDTGFCLETARDEQKKIRSAVVTKVDIRGRTAYVDFQIRFQEPLEGTFVGVGNYKEKELEGFDLQFLLAKDTERGWLIDDVGRQPKNVGRFSR